ncbi:MAG TPA: tRNA (N(6)-L-threonylcarbamoyladenosine(37)-C(2))-methylthiotransferase [Methanothrix sp.]|nr:tRNA (N(6)-L-threonylcarbamoyladenosine(37)-C(2))-methylthiotransferase [Methanothrix sp.]HOK58767.1 tRNA (N(6)-L-threonylcarbamoyladenosine(37)-C(2))-methylthiotransferase [Methanothrix sp.]HOL42978.1 tRNA (N(6)-L-threonylcarbamoyladenosine(37)-C(2))-methylthiotransferase [Methanothrix sp.]HPO87981.1 tRNA (N(6)-L-threonylcarbamoyladenosine(37)-C(2))-methylthiotransferase [Methanothrix sp.]
MRFCIETHGCTANIGNSMELRRMLIAHGHQESDLDDSDVVILNTCAVTSRTERDMLRRIGELRSRRLIVAGCLPAAIPELIVGFEALGVLNRDGMEKVLDALGRSENPEPDRPIPCLPGSLCGVVSISEGCLGACTYCIVKKARGPLRSREPREIESDVRHLINSGAVEIQLASQDAGAYGCDIGTSLPELLDLLSDMGGAFMIRVGMMNPSSVLRILDDLLDSYRSEKIYRFLHLPLQSGSDRVLERMGRGYTSADFVHIVNEFRSRFPDISLTTDVITGFPGETDQDFRMTENVIRTTQPDKVNVTRYSRRPHTPAFMMHDMPDRIKKERSRRMTELWKEIALLRNSRYTGHELDVLVTEHGRAGSMKGRTRNYTGVVVHGASYIGKWVRARATDATPFYIKARCTGSLWTL